MKSSYVFVAVAQNKSKSLHYENFGKPLADHKVSVSERDRPHGRTNGGRTQLRLNHVKRADTSQSLGAPLHGPELKLKRSMT